MPRELETPHEAFLTTRAPDVVPEDVLEVPPVRAQVEADGYDPRHGDVCDTFKAILSRAKDPAVDERQQGTFRVAKVWAVFKPDERGLVEVLFTTDSGYQYVNGVRQPPHREQRRAFLRGTDLVYLEAGW